MRHNGRPQSVRRILFEAMHGQLQPGERVYRQCSDPRCVNPQHAGRIGDLPGSHDVPSFDDEMTVDDVIDLILSLDDEDRTVDHILTRGWDTSTEMIKAALSRL